jgi:hypothetical protein
MEAKMRSHLLYLRSTASKIALSVLIMLLPVSETAAADTQVLNIFLVQNSGWMEPFYVDPTSKFKPLIKTVIERVARSGENIVIASFNQSIGDNHSPFLVYRGNDPGAIVKAIQGITLAKKPGGRAYADTDFKEAVVGAITQYSPGRPCILWIFTNNRNSPHDSPETAAKNRKFYQWLQNEDNIKRIVAYTYPMPVQGVHYHANGLMVYAMAYGKPASEALEKLIAANKLPFEDQPARLKPLNTDAVTFVPTGVAEQGNYSAFLSADRNTLVLQFDSAGKPEVAIINGVFRNDFFPYDIHSADVSMDVKFHGESHGIRSEIEPRKLASLPTGKQTSAVAVKIKIPPLPSMWRHPEIIFKTGHQIQAIMEFTLTNQKLQLSPDFLERMNKLFPGDPLPEIFVPDKSSKQSVTSMPLLVKVKYPVWPLVVLALLIGTFGIGSLFLLTALTRAKKFTVFVDGMQKTYSLKALSECSIYTDRGERIGSLKRGLGKPRVRLEEGREEKVNIL